MSMSKFIWKKKANNSLPSFWIDYFDNRTKWNFEQIIGKNQFQFNKAFDFTILHIPTN